VLSINETWLDNSITDSALYIPGFNIFRNDRNRNGGGVALYVRSEFHATHLPMPVEASDIEALFIRTKSTKFDPITIGSVYRPPGSAVQFWEAFSSAFEHCAGNIDRTVLLGDFNIDVSRPNAPQHSYLQEHCQEFCLRNVVHQPTRTPSNSCLDLALISSELQIASCSIIPQFGLTDHHLVHLEVAQNVKISTRVTKQVRKPPIRKLDAVKCSRSIVVALQDSCFNDDWGGHDRPSVNDFVSAFTDTATTALNQYAPLTTITVPTCGKPKPQPWVNGDLKRLLEKRKHLHKRVTKHPGNATLLQQYRSLRREGTLLNRRLRRQYYLQQFKSVKSKPRRQWALLNTLTGRQILPTPPGASLRNLTDTFASIVTSPTGQQTLRAPVISDEDETDAPILSCFTHVTVEDVERLLKSLDGSKAAGPDGISPLYLKRCSSSFVLPITKIINESLSTGTFPDEFKTATVCPIHKSGDRTDASNYRPVSLLPIVSKLVEKVVHRQLMAFIEDNSELHLLPPEQFAYRKMHSCEDLLTLATSRWMTSIDEGEQCGIVFVDMSKAFDRVNHQTLINELHAMGLRGSVLNWFMTYLRGRQQSVKIGSAQGPVTPCTRGVPQGSVLGPLLFSVYVRHVPGKFLRSHCHQFADDIAFYVARKDVFEIKDILSRELNVLNRYLTDVGLLLNPKKTKFMILRRKGTALPADLALDCAGTIIPISASARYLGLIIDQHLTFEEQVNSVATKVFSKIRAFARIRDTVSHEAKRIFYLSLIQSTLEYSSNAYVHSLSATLHSRLVRLSHKCMKKVFGLSRFTSIDFVLSHTRLYSLESRLNLKLYVMIFRTLHHQTSPLLSSLFTLRSDSTHTDRVTRGQSSFSLSLPKPRTRIGLFSIPYLGADRWNSLPSDCRQADHLPAFINTCKKFLGFPVTRRQRL